MAKRYGQMIPIIAKLKPQVIVEVGVHRGARSAALSREMMRHVHKGRYVGFDVFDALGDEFQALALNGKGTPTEAQARAALDPIANLFLGFSYTLFVGDTRETLHGNTIDADFAFIDGDHRVEAIRGDYESLKWSKVVVFDDYYVAGPDGSLPDLERFGANAIVDALKAEGRDVEILPAADPCNHGALTHLAVVRL